MKAHRCRKLQNFCNLRKRSIARMTVVRLWWRLHQERAAISDDGVANKMAQMASIFTYGPLLAPPPSHRRGDEEEKITLQPNRYAVPQSHRDLGRNVPESPVDICSSIRSEWRVHFPLNQPDAAFRHPRNLVPVSANMRSSRFPVMIGAAAPPYSQGAPPLDPHRQGRPVPSRAATLPPKKTIGGSVPLHFRNRCEVIAATTARSIGGKANLHPWLSSHVASAARTPMPREKFR